MFDALSGFIVEWMWLVIVVLFAAFAALEFASRGFPGQRDGGTRRVVVNFGLALLSAATELAVPVGTLAVAAFADEQGIGLFNVVAAPGLLVLAATFVARTFVAYWLHRAMHAVPWLWRIHRVHHSDRDFDVTLGLRQHPLAGPVSLPFHAATGLLLGLPAWAVVIVDTALLAAAYWEHTDAPLSPRWSRIFSGTVMTPNAHRVHHSAWQPQTDRNFGPALLVWDRLFGTFADPAKSGVERIGLGDEHDQWADSLWQQLVLPFRLVPADRVAGTQELAPERP